MSGDTEWRWADPSGKQRLVRTDELRAALAGGVIAPNAPVWRAGWSEWRPATEVPELATSALSAANGVVPNIPPPPMAVVAAQHAFQGDAVPLAGESKEEPPPPPAYVPARPQSGIQHAPAQPMQVARVASTITSVNIRTLEEKNADADGARPSAPPPRPSGPPRATAKSAPPPPPSRSPPPMQNPPPPPSLPPTTSAARQGSSVTSIGLPALVRSAPPPPVRAGSKPPPPPPRSTNPASRPPSKAPPRVEDAGKEVIEELSGSVLLSDGSGAQNIIEELSGSILLPDQSGAIHAGVVEKSGALLLPDLSGPAPAIPTRLAEELTGNFLLDAGSTGALPSVESTGKILAAKAASRAPFAPTYEPGASRPSFAPIVPLSLPLGSAPPPPPSHMLEAQASPAPAAPAPADVPPEQLAPHVTTLRQFQPQPVSGPPGAGTGAPAIVPDAPANATLLGVSPPPAQLLDNESALVSPDANAPPAPTALRTADEQLPPPERSSARLHDFRALGHNPRARSVLIGVGAVAVVAVLGLIGLIAGAVRTKPSDEPVPSLALSSSATSGALSTTSAPAATVVAAAPLPGALGAACSLAGAAHVIAPRGVVQSGVEASLVGAHLAVGFSSREREGIAVAIDPSSAGATQTVRIRAGGPIRRLVPIEGAQGLAAAADVDHPSDFLGGRRTIPAAHPFDLGFGGGGVASAPYGSSQVSLIWTLEGDEPVEAIRAAPLDPSHEEAGWAIAFRRGAAIYAGAVQGSDALTPKGPLVKVVGLGPQVGSPTVAAQDGAVLVAWADRAQPSDPWSLRWIRFAPGDASVEAKPFVPSEGGLGEHAMSPAIFAAGQGRFVLAWTEGPVATHQVRAQTITGSGAPLGTAMAISDSGVNAGQAQLAILPDGHGVVAYLASSGAGGAAGPKAAYEVLATPIVCP